MTDRETLYDILHRARPTKPWCVLNVRESSDKTIVHTGPDDAEAVFFFDPDGSIKAVAVVEANGDRQTVDPPSGYVPVEKLKEG